MPANRSRTERWREGLHQICDRGGGLEFSIAGPEDAGAERTPDLVWRVKLLAMNDAELLVEHPNTAGKQLRIEVGTGLVGVMVIGQNRWMFRTRVLGANDGPSPWTRQVAGLRLETPTRVERCARREFLRVSLAELRLPKVECRPLLDPAGVAAAENANRAMITDLSNGAAPSEGMDELLRPEVGPAFGARLINIGGGGVGLLLDRNDATGMGHTRLLWLRLDLRPAIPAPLALVGKVVHSHLDSEQNLYVGVAFEFAFNPSHRTFVVQQIERAIVRPRLAA